MNKIWDVYFSGSKPNLINKKILKHYENSFTVEPVVQTGGWGEYLSYFYYEYIQHNLLLIILLAIFIIFLIYRYKTRDLYDEDNNTNKINNKVNTNMDDENDDNYNDNNNDIYEGFIDDCIEDSEGYKGPFTPTFNPYYPVKEQSSYVNYLPDSFPYEQNGEFYNNEPTDPIINHYKYPSNVNWDEHVDYTGLTNTYYGAEDPVLPNALGLPSNYNTTTAESVAYMTTQNRRSVDMMADIMFDQNKL